MIIGYCRQGILGTTSGLQRQIDELSAMGAERVVHDRALAFGSSALEHAIDDAKSGDVIVVRRSHHLALTSRGVLALIRRLASKGVGLRILNTPLDTSTTTGRMVLASTPLWSLNVSPLQSVIAELGNAIGRR